MAPPNLTRADAQARAALLQVADYTVALDLTDGGGKPGQSTFASDVTVRFSCREPGASSWIDFVGAQVHSATLNGVALDVSGYREDDGIALPDLAADNELRVNALGRYMNTGEGLHRFVDPVDGQVYLYSQFETADCKRLFACFDQPDLKARYTLTVTAPEDWEVISNAVADSVEDGVHRFATSEILSTYLVALIAGPYASWHDTYSDDGGEIPLGLYCRASLAQHMDAERLFRETKQGFGFFHKSFGVRYPFGKYDQLFVPEFNAGAMENAAAVTFLEDYVFRSRVTRPVYERRAETVLHEMAHMWFGDLVTMRWWDDLWLNESFATFASVLCQVDATEYTEAWTTFANVEKSWAYRQDQLPSTHPVAADNHDLEAVEVNFDGITYAKGASVLKQLVAWVGEEEFLAGLRDYFKKHAFANSEFIDLLRSLEASSGRDLGSWGEEWLQTSGVNTLSPDFEVDDAGTFTAFRVRQTAQAGSSTLRRHRVAIGLYDDVDGRLVRRRSLETDVFGATTEVTDLVGEKQPDLVLLNDGDLAYAKIRLDERSLDTLVGRIDTLDDSLARALCWGAAWDMTRDAEMAASDFAALVLKGVATETDLTAVGALLRYAKQAVDTDSAPVHRAALKQRWEEGLSRLVDGAEAGSDHQLAFVRAFGAAARSDAAVDRVAAWYAGGDVPEGLVVDTDLRWALLSCLSANGRVDDAEIERQLQQDNTISGQERAAAARAVRPSAEAKEAAWEAAVVRDNTPNETQRQIAVAFQVPGQDEVLAPYVDRYLEAAETVWESKGVYSASVVLQYLFPRALATPETLARVRSWLDTTSANPAAVRYVREGASDLERALAAQERDAA